MEVNITVYILKQVDAGGREQRPKIPERCRNGAHSVQPIVDYDIHLPLEALEADKRNTNNSAV